MEKIAFLYVSEILPGKIANDVHRPVPWVTKETLPVTTNFDVTFGLILKVREPYKVEVDVFFDGKSLLGKDRDDVSADPIVSYVNHDDDYVSIENMSLFGVEISNYGLHRVVAKLYGTSGTVSEENLLSEQECYFVVSKGWLK
ncbi:hypothetical protein ACLH01_00035 [Enterobacter cloacae]|uniref:hypothetical protein n=1 Tax=Enterobacter cloacae TaxID=550 RepID=UPI003984582C